MTDAQGEHHDDLGFVAYHGTPADGTADPGLAGLVAGEEQLDFDGIAQKAEGDKPVFDDQDGQLPTDSGPAAASGTEGGDEAQPEPVADTTSTSAAPETIDSPEKDEATATEATDSLDAEDLDEAGKKEKLDAGDVLQTEGEEDLDALLAGQPEKKPIPVADDAAGDEGAAAEGKAPADGGPAEPAAPDSAALDANLVDGGDDQAT